LDKPVPGKRKAKALTASRADELFMNSPLQETPGAEAKNNSNKTFSQTAIGRRGYPRQSCAERESFPKIVDEKNERPRQPIR
jgi:hypothetical protein